MRSLTSGQNTAIQSASVTMVWFVELGFSTTQRFCTAGHSLTWNGYTWAGLGSIVDIEPIEETDTMEATGYRLSVTLTSTSLVSLALSEDVQGDSCKVWLGLFDSAGVLIDTPVQVDVGVCDQVQIDHSKASAMFSLSVESEMADWSRPNVVRYTDADHQAIYPNDPFFAFVAQMAEKAVAWPSRELQA